MAIMRFRLGDYLSSFQKRLIIYKLSNLQEISPVPISYVDGEVVIGDYNSSSEKGIWDDLYEQLGYRAHCV